MLLRKYLNKTVLNYFYKFLIKKLPNILIILITFEYFFYKLNVEYIYSISNLDDKDLRV
jgi:hypothetical protein